MLKKKILLYFLWLNLFFNFLTFFALRSSLNCLNIPKSTIKIDYLYDGKKKRSTEYKYKITFLKLNKEYFLFSNNEENILFLRTYYFLELLKNHYFDYDPLKKDNLSFQISSYFKQNYPFFPPVLDSEEGYGYEDFYPSFAFFLYKKNLFKNKYFWKINAFIYQNNILNIQPKTDLIKDNGENYNIFAQLQKPLFFVGEMPLKNTIFKANNLEKNYLKRIFLNKNIDDEILLKDKNFEDQNPKKNFLIGKEEEIDIFNYRAKLFIKNYSFLFLQFDKKILFFNNINRKIEFTPYKYCLASFFYKNYSLDKCNSIYDVNYSNTLSFFDFEKLFSERMLYDDVYIKHNDFNYEFNREVFHKNKKELRELIVKKKTLIIKQIDFLKRFYVYYFWQFFYIYKYVFLN